MKRFAILSALLAGVSAAGLGHAYLMRLEAEVSGGMKTSVLVAAKDFPMGTIVEEDLLAVREIPEAYIDRRYVRASDVKKVVGARASQSLHTNEAVLYSDLSEYSERSRELSGLIQQGMRAVIVNGSAARFAGLLGPGDRVDVLLTTNAEGGSNTVTLLQNMLVLSVGTSITGSEELKLPGAAARARDSKFSRRGAVTLSATVEQAQIITQAKQSGELSLTLRNPDDIELVEGIEKTTAQEVTKATARLDWRRAAPEPQPDKQEIEHVH